MSDLIDKNIAIATLKNSRWGFVWEYDRAIEVIESLPSARKNGKWIRRKGADCWECSECHAVLEDHDLQLHNFYYCYHCGADMLNEHGYMNIEELTNE